MESPMLMGISDSERSVQRRRNCVSWRLLSCAGINARDLVSPFSLFFFLLNDDAIGIFESSPRVIYRSSFRRNARMSADYAEFS